MSKEKNTRSSVPPQASLWHERRCSFCDKTREEVRKLVVSASVSICDECAALVEQILFDDGLVLRPPPTPKSTRINIKKLGIKPNFRKLRFEIRRDHCFYLCPFREPFNTIYKDHVLPAIQKANFTVERADEIFGTQPIIEDIWEAINSATIILADTTGRNPNVMYEIGIAHTVGKPVVLITQSMEDVPFDLKHHRCIIYEYTPRGCRELEEKITGTLRFAKNK